jgi:hypothetical protein
MRNSTHQTIVKSANRHRAWLAKEIDKIKAERNLAVQAARLKQTGVLCDIYS